MAYTHIVIGASAGGQRAMSQILKALPIDFPAIVLFVQHQAKDTGEALIEALQPASRLKVKNAEDKDEMVKGTVYVSPPGYHMLIETDATISLSVDMKEHYSRPSIDVLFETASSHFKDKLIGVLLTGANDDGAAGIASIKRHCGMTIVQNPTDAEFGEMPSSALKKSAVDKVLDLVDIGPFIVSQIV